MFKHLARMAEMKLSRMRHTAPHGLMFLAIWVTESCNLSCRMCDQWRATTSGGRTPLSREEWFSVIASAKALGTLVVLISGGEALLSPDALPLLERIRDRGMAAHLCTNGTTLTEENVAGLAKARVASVSISLDGTSPEIHDELRGAQCFDRVVEGVRRARAALPRAKININFLLCRRNYRHMAEMIDLCRDLAVDQVNIQPIHTNLQHRKKPLESYDDLLFRSEDLAALPAELDRMRARARAAGMRTSSSPFLDGISRFYSGEPPFHGCFAGYLSCAVSPWGDVSPCMDMDVSEGVREKPLHELWRSPAFNALRDRVRSCRERCWDTTNAEMAIRCTVPGALRTLGDSLKDLSLYTGRNR